MPTYNLMNEQVNTSDMGQIQNIAPITSSTQDISGAFSNVQTGQPISINTLKTPVAPLIVPQPTINTTAADTAVAGAAQGAQSYQNILAQATAPKTAEQTQADSLTQSLMDLVEQDTGKVQALSTAEANAGVPGMQQQLTDLNNSVLQGKAEYDQLKISYDATSVDNRGKAISMSSIIGNEAQINYARASALNTKAAEINMNVARSQAVQGNIASAQATAQKAVDLQYAAIEDQIRVKQAQLQLFQPILNKQESQQAAALNLMYDNQKVALADQKAKDTQLQNIGIAAAANDAPKNLIDTALATKNPIQATDLLSQYIKGNLESSTSTGLTQGTLFKVPTAKELGGSQFYKYPSSSIVYSSNGTALSFQQFKDATGQSAVPDAQVKFGGIKTLSPTTSGTPTTTTTLKPTSDTSGEIKAWLIANKRANPNISYYDLWGQLADEMQKEGLNPSNYDKVFWEILHPEGLAGYAKEQKKLKANQLEP